MAIRPRARIFHKTLGLMLYLLLIPRCQGNNKSDTVEPRLSGMEIL